MSDITSPMRPLFLCYDSETWRQDVDAMDGFENKKNIEGTTHGHCPRGG